MGEREEDRNEPKVFSFRNALVKIPIIKIVNQERNKGLISVWGKFSYKYLRFKQVAIFFLLPLSLYIFNL